MKMRSLLFVPGDRPSWMAKAVLSEADVVILDLEDSVTLEKKAYARQAVSELLSKPRSVPVFVRINPLGTLAAEDLSAIAPASPDGLMLPKAEGCSSIEALDKLLLQFGKESLPILPITTETPAAIFSLGEYRRIGRRLCGMTWGAEDLSAEVGATTARISDQIYTPPYELARSLCLFAAHSAHVPAIETVYPNLQSESGLKAYAEKGRRDGFSGMLALHPSQVPVINAAFKPSEVELAWAREIVAAFENNPQGGAIKVGGRMVDAPHLKMARRIIFQSSTDEP